MVSPAHPHRGRPRRTRAARAGIAAVAVVVAVALLAGAGLGWRGWTTRAQGAPSAVEFVDATLSSALTDATVLALGEATHGNAEFQLLRLQLLRKLPQFRAIAWEEDFGSLAQVDAWVQGGSGTVEDAVARFGFRLNRTTQTAELLTWLRDHNVRATPAERIRLVGIDVQRVDANKQLALDWLATVDPAASQRFAQELDAWTDDHADAATRAEVADVVDALVAALADTEPNSGEPAAAWRTARNAARTLQQNLQLAASSNLGYAPLRARLMAENLQRTVAEEAERGNPHTLLFAHDGHVDKDSAAYRHDDLGTLAAQTWGDAYRVIGTEFHHSVVSTGQGTQRWQVSIDNPTPLRGLFAGTSVGFVELAALTGDNRALVDRAVRMGSVGEGFQQWQAYVPWLRSVRMVPSRSYDALVLVDRATPTTPLP